MESTTIAAISTPPGTGGIGIIKISGPAALTIGRKLFQKKNSSGALTDDKSSGYSSSFIFKSHRFFYGHIIDPDTNHPVDEVLTVFMKAPFSYTREDVLEIHSHSGHTVLRTILNLVLSNGAKIAQPGEFTERAFLNGRIDLTQAEAVMDIINAKSRCSLDIATAQMKGELKEILLKAKNELFKTQVLCEAFIDFSDDFDEDFKTKDTIACLHTRVEKPLKKLIKNYENGHVIREGIRIAIIGKPNVGKSSLMNCLLNKERVIVTNIPGTTRDVVEEALNIHGIAVILSDTAGLHQTKDPVEVIGMKKTDEYIERADLIIFMKDASGPLEEDDTRIYKQIKNKKHIVVRNKIDIIGIADSNSKKSKNEIDVSVLKNIGIAELKRKILQTADINATSKICHGIIPNLRQKNLIEKTIRHVTSVIQGMKKGVFLELLVLDIHDALESLNHILGISVREDVQRKIFDQFCIGK